ncbi:hypothetical protein Htur_5016 (plasmid) [Haloterrigena turkmenica DSM 5511]|uniref:Uncharacterized protein n=1 Tax=Haloterrigena turkmenica (strain ATCC 51198 / DSM 5511 / JCM 9101 / NCIMB 13204 / VKM B-1734 / 4k) TaxID=543526 RepID=D2S3F7_HALTV|nr:hypothetical protein [Haloterrigena turkmenica]ADB63904.1 hypothetical protein Htur_5016 [Haloterrigena turkmenica DSM 5511]
MSQSQQRLEQQRREAADESPFRRDMWWGKDRDGTEKTTGHDPQPFHYRKERCEYVMTGFWKETAERLLCPVAYHEPGEYDLHDEPCEVEVSDPAVFIPKRAPDWHADGEYGAMSHRVRVNEEHGNLTGPLVPDRPKPDFMEGVNDLLGHWGDELDLSDGNLETLRETAERRKRNGDDRDVDIVAGLMQDAWRMAKTGE